MNPVIVYLAQNTSKDSQYGRDSRSMLEKSLDLLYKNYNNRFKHDILIFHEGDFTQKDQKEVIRDRKEINFFRIHFKTPGFLNEKEIPKLWPAGNEAGFGMGHRHMIRFYAVQLFDILNDLGYDWFFRMDDDSFIHSRINYNLFEFMEQGGYEYGYRVDVNEKNRASLGFGETVLGYLKAEKIRPEHFYEHLVPTTIRDLVMNLLKSLLMIIIHKKRFILSPSIQYDLWGYYNNFFITKIDFWKSQKVQAFIHYFDRIGGWYKYRWNDLIFQSAAVQIFMPKEKVYKFTDWTYEHATVKGKELKYGGIYEGSDDRDSISVKEFIRIHGQKRKPINGSY
jgi:hypothetical protein